MSSSAPKKPKVSKKFREEYTRIWPFIKPSHISDKHALCTICDEDIKISSGAKSDIEKHIGIDVFDLIFTYSFRGLFCYS